MLLPIAPQPARKEPIPSLMDSGLESRRVLRRWISMTLHRWETAATIILPPRGEQLDQADVVELVVYRKRCSGYNEQV
jgi:hypothetical protein